MLSKYLWCGDILKMVIVNLEIILLTKYQKHMVNIVTGGFNLIILNIRKHFVMIILSQENNELFCEGKRFVSPKVLGKCWQG